MPRRWLSGILFALALAVQALTPVANGVAAARGTDLVRLTEICLKAAEASGDRGHAPGQFHVHHDCALCKAFGDGVTPIVARPAPAGLAPVQWREADWTAPHGVWRVSPRDYARQARAPPIFS